LKKYYHSGWTGEPYKSDFEAKWGLIRFDEMYDCSHETNLMAAADIARKAGYSYVIAGRQSPHKNRLFKVNKTGHRCVVAMLGYLQKNAKKESVKYHTDTDERVKQIVRVARTRALQRGIPFDLDPDDIIMRVRNGVCEATGAKFNLDDIGSPFAPSLDQVVPSGGYTKSNVKVVCMIYNGMKADYSAEQVNEFIAVLRRQVA
jgi:hypothetical protein